MMPACRLTDLNQIYAAPLLWLAWPGVDRPLAVVIGFTVTGSCSSSF